LKSLKLVLISGYTSFSPPPLSSRYELESLTTAYEAKKGKRRWRWGHLRFPKAIDRQGRNYFFLNIL